MTNAKGGLEDRDWLDKVRSENELVLPVKAQTVRRELLSENVESTIHILGPLVDDVKVGIGFNQTTGSSTDGRAHVGDEETTVRFGTNFISNR